MSSMAKRKRKGVRKNIQIATNEVINAIEDLTFFKRFKLCMKILMKKL